MALIGDFLKALGQLGDRAFLLVFAKAVGLTIGLLILMTLILGWLVSFVPTDLGEWWLIGQVTLPTEALQRTASEPGDAAADELLDLASTRRPGVMLTVSQGLPVIAQAVGRVLSEGLAPGERAFFDVVDRTRRRVESRIRDLSHLFATFRDLVHPKSARDKSVDRAGQSSEIAI